MERRGRAMVSPSNAYVSSNRTRDASMTILIHLGYRMASLSARPSDTADAKSGAFISREAAAENCS